VKGELARYAVLAPVVHLERSFVENVFPKHWRLCKQLGLKCLVLNHNVENSFEHARNIKSAEGALRYKAVALDQVTKGGHTVMLVLVPSASGVQYALHSHFPNVRVCGHVGWVPLSCVSPLSAPTLTYTKQRDVYTDMDVPSAAVFQFRSVEVLMPGGSVFW
jgi:hypothetical protein